MGTGPFRFIGIATIPSPSLAEANADAYNNALRELPRNLIGGCGTCYNCGMAITRVCIVQNSTGERYGIGSDCVLKTGDPSLGDAAKVAIARLQRKARRERAETQRHARQVAWESTICNDRGETNAQRVDRENRKLELARRTQLEEVSQRFAFLLPYLTGPSGGFYESIANGIRSGQAPRGRALDICGDIYAKSFGRRGSKGYQDALDDFLTKVSAA